MKMIFTSFCLALSVLFVGCASWPLDYSSSVSHRSEKDNIIGPFTPVRAVSPTVIEATLAEEGQPPRAVSLQLRGISPAPGEQFNHSAKVWLDRKVIRCMYGGGIFVLRDTMDTSVTNAIRGILLRPLQKSIGHNVATGESVVSVIRYRIIQASCLSHGHYLVDESDMSFGWRRYLLSWQKVGKQCMRGFWKPSEDREEPNK